MILAVNQDMKVAIEARTLQQEFSGDAVADPTFVNFYLWTYGVSLQLAIMKPKEDVHV